MELDKTRIEDAIIREVADSIIGDADLNSHILKAVNDRIDAHFSKTANDQIQTAIEAAITNGFEREYCRVDSFGHRVGEPTTIKAQLEKTIAGYWNARVDRNGKDTDSSYNTTTRAEWLMTKLVAADFQGDMKQHVVNIGGALKDKLRAELHDTVNRLLSEVINVRSLEDEELRRGDRSCIDPKQTKVTA